MLNNLVYFMVFALSSGFSTEGLLFFFFLEFLDSRGRFLCLLSCPFGDKGSEASPWGALREVLSCPFGDRRGDVGFTRGYRRESSL